MIVMVLKEIMHIQSSLNDNTRRPETDNLFGPYIHIHSHLFVHSSTSLRTSWMHVQKLFLLHAAQSNSTLAFHYATIHNARDSLQYTTVGQTIMSAYRCTRPTGRNL